MTKPCLAFDVETIPDPRIIHDPDLCEEVRNNVALGNTKDPAKIEAKRDEALESWRNDKASFRRWSARVVAIGWSDLDKGPIRAYVSYTQERRVLTSFVRAIEKHYGDAGAVLGTFNGRRFDVPLITFRCGIRKVKLPPWWPGAGSYANEQADLMDLFPDDKLAYVAKAHGLPPKLASGADVKHMTADECRKYVKRDVLIERALLRIYRDRFKALRSRGVA